MAPPQNLYSEKSGGCPTWPITCVVVQCRERGLGREFKVTMGIWEGVAMDSLKFHPGPPPCPTLLRPAGGPPLKLLYGCFKGSPPTGLSSTPLDTHAVRLYKLPNQFFWNTFWTLFRPERTESHGKETFSES
jgi:hypothetical protein